MRKHYAGRMKKGKILPGVQQEYILCGIAIDGEIVLRNGSIRIGYYD